MYQQYGSDVRHLKGGYASAISWNQGLRQITLSFIGFFASLAQCSHASSPAGIFSRLPPPDVIPSAAVGQDPVPVVVLGHRRQNTRPVVHLLQLGKGGCFSWRREGDRIAGFHSLEIRFILQHFYNIILIFNPAK
jgi:hypothetical protein